MGFANKQLRNQYRVRAHNIGSSAIRLVNDFFSSGIEDNISIPIGSGWVESSWRKWTLTDLDRALYEMGKAKS